ncbi:hypothetical protein [Phaeacidiphilus oryzae]|uniref:hypothetical protein n=1 Tax=Phaeacidiphilus oryzae TaxID=348818 RepID=UPI0005650929|nr:hypothetical protein [Phaeacidiphilus oryzae]
MATWITAIIKNDSTQLCSVMLNPGQGSASPQPVSPQQCASGAPQILKTYHPMLTPKGESGSPEVKVAGPAATGDTANFPAREIHVDGKPLRAVLNATSSGLTPAQQNKQKFVVNASRHGSSWYVTGIDGI